MFGSKKTMRKDGITIVLEIISDDSDSSVVNVKITDKKNRRIVVNTPPIKVEFDDSLRAMPGGAYC